MKALTASLLALLALSFAACDNTVAGFGPGADRGVDAGVEEPDTEDPNGEDEPPKDDVEEEVAPLDLQLDPTELALESETTFQVTAIISREGQPVEATLLWQSNDEAVASVDADGLITAIAAGETTITAAVDESVASISVRVYAAVECPAGTGNNGDSCADIYQGQDIWRCTVSPNLGDATVSQVCRDQGAGPQWITFHIDPTDCCACEGDFNVGCCAANSGSTGCP